MEAVKKKIEVSIGDKDLLNKEEVKAYLGVGAESIDKMIIDGLPRYNLVGKRVYFLKQDIIDFAKTRRI